MTLLYEKLKRGLLDAIARQDKLVQEAEEEIKESARAIDEFLRTLASPSSVEKTRKED